MVSWVAHQHEKEPERIDQQFDAIAALVTNGKLAIEQGDLKGLGQLMTMNQRLLAGLMLSTAPLEEMIAAALEAGALGAKLTGAGGGGCMIALVEGEQEKHTVAEALRRLDKAVYEVESGA